MMNYCGKKLIKSLVKEFYEFRKGSLHPRYKDRDRIINAALDAATGASDDILIYKVSITRWVDSDNIVYREQTSKELALKVAARPTRGTGGWIDYEE